MAIDVVLLWLGSINVVFGKEHRGIQRNYRSRRMVIPENLKEFEKIIIKKTFKKSKRIFSIQSERDNKEKATSCCRRSLQLYHYGRSPSKNIDFKTGN